MKLNRFFKSLYISIPISIILFLALIIFINDEATKTLPTFYPMSDNSVINEDLDGNGSKDALYIKTNDVNYLIQVNLNGKSSLSLNPSKELATLGEHKNYWPIRITINDISRNNVKEIFTQASNGESSIQNVFIFKDNSYENVLATKNNILGIIDNSNNKTPKLISGNFNSGYMDLHSYIIVNNDLKEFPYIYEENYIGDKLICNFINLIQSFPNESLELPSYFTDNLNYNSTSQIYTAANNQYSYILQDCFFKDITYDEKGLPKDISWTLNFKGRNINDSKNIKNFTFDVILTRNSNSFDYKITSLDLSY